MQKLIAGIHKFREHEFGKYEELFHKLSEEGQNPHTLFITCSDSRVLAELITHSMPGDLFVVKNVGNIVPPADASANKESTGAAIEFAVEILKVKDIVICGHSLCGAMSALLFGLSKAQETPHLEKWLNFAMPVRRLIDKNYHGLIDDETKLTAAAIENVLFGLENLRTYPAVEKHVLAGKLRLHGWFFKIATAEMFAYDPFKEQFQLIESRSKKSHEH